LEEQINQLAQQPPDLGPFGQIAGHFELPAHEQLVKADFSRDHAHKMVETGRHKRVRVGPASAGCTR